MRSTRRLRTSRWSAVGTLAAVLASAGVLAACTGESDPSGDSTGPTAIAGGGPGPPTPITDASSPTRPTAHPTVSRPPAPRPTPPTDPHPSTLRPVAVPAACELNAPADGVQRAADAGHIPWRLDPAQVVLQCLRRGLGGAAWRVSRIGEHAVAVTEARSRPIARIRLEQPALHGPAGIWAVTGIDANKELILPPACIEPDPAGLQAAFDQGHQPWRGSPVMVAEACARAAWGWPHPHGQLFPDYVLVVDHSTGEVVEVRGRRWRSAGDSIWLVTSAEPEVGQD
jgi:hypothetical protein